MVSFVSGLKKGIQDPASKNVSIQETVWPDQWWKQQMLLHNDDYTKLIPFLFVLRVSSQADLENIHSKLNSTREGK